MSALGDAALRLAEQGWPVFPLLPGGKSPLISKDRGGRGCHDATVDQGRIGAWWALHPTANIGAATGGAFVVLDVDGAEGLDFLADLEDLHRWLPVGPASVTGSGGLHLFFRPNMRVGNTVGRLGTGLDTRGAGGSAVLPPSVHPNGCRYAWLRGREPWTLALPEMPDWLLGRLDPPRPAYEPRPAPTRNAGKYVRVALERELNAVAASPAGERNGSLFRAAAAVSRFVAAGDLAAAEVGPLLVDAAVAAGLPRREAEATATSGLRRALA